MTVRRAATVWERSPPPSWHSRMSPGLALSRFAVMFGTPGRARTTPAAAKLWLARQRPTRVIGGGFWTPEQAFQASLGKSFDVVIHFHSVKAAHLLP
ncbi:hypothetical protein [Actinomadura opuntiae]|uniref:hypothetical protein n=1 Tax=Actinomadura sp. OS1-43 TaxID=604315 RepID=UPI00255AD292|nr:hypothetical protein [Actinomadura sp. OS1-43]MDL4817389.1 hypothetical protein [Actinomadura sp. OS1-43]